MWYLSSYLFFHGAPSLTPQLRNKLNQEQNSKLQQQRDSLNKRNLEVAAMDKRVSELRDRLWKKKAALQQKENLPVSQSSASLRPFQEPFSKICQGNFYSCSSGSLRPFHDFYSCSSDS